MKMYLIRCVVCGKYFEAKRYDAKTCSSSCRVKLHFTETYQFCREIISISRNNTNITDVSIDLIEKMKQQNQYFRYSYLPKVLEAVDAPLIKLGFIDVNEELNFIDFAQKYNYTFFLCYCVPDVSNELKVAIFVDGNLIEKPVFQESRLKEIMPTFVIEKELINKVEII